MKLMKTFFKGNVHAAARGVVISLAVAFGSATAFADGLISLGLGSTGVATADALAESGLPTASLEHLALGSGGISLPSRASAVNPSIVRSNSSGNSHPASTEDRTPDHDVFPLLGQVLPLLVTTPQARAADVRPIRGAGRNLVVPVGVASSSLR